MSIEKHDIIIIGCGILGAMTAAELAARGKSCAVIEEREIFHPLAGSFAATRAGHSLYDDGLYRDYAQKSLALYEQLFPGCLEKTGALLLEEAKSPSFARKVFDAGAGYFDWLDSGALQAAYADLRPRAACADSNGGLFLCRKITAALMEKLKQEKITLYQGEKIIGAGEKSGAFFTLSLSDGRELQAKKIIVAAGLGSESLLDLLSPRPSPVKFLTPKSPRALHYKFKGRPLKIPAFAAIETGFFHLPPSAKDPEGCGKIAVFTSSFTQTEAEDLGAMADQYIMNFSSETFFVETPFDKCLYDLTPDGHFVVGPSAMDQNILLGCGLNGTGYKFAPLIARLLATKALNETGDIPAEWLPSRFGL